jgi:tetratricopeptide (TPR) repeat protein
MAVTVSAPSASTRFRLATVLIPALLVAFLASCGGPDLARRRAAAELLSDVEADSLGIAEFLALPGAQRDARRERARTWLRHAADTADPWSRAQAVRAAAGLVPDDPSVWLDLAEVRSWLGDDLGTDAALSAATAAIRQLNEPDADLRVDRGERDGIAVRASLQRAWYHYGRAEWHEGLGWARAALSVEPGNRRALVVKGLLDAAVHQTIRAERTASDLARRDPADPAVSWIHVLIDRAMGDDIAAYNIASRMKLGRDGSVRGLASIGVRSPDDRVAEFWQDMGALAEALGEWAQARWWYGEAAAALPLTATRYRSRFDGPRLGDPASAADLPVWLAFDRNFLAGSRSTYTALVFARFDAATTPADRTLWGGMTVNATGILLRRGEDRPWALRARGLVFLDRGNLERARSDLERAERLFAEEDREDPRVTAGLGRMWLQEEDHRRALPYLERAVRLAPMDPEAWSDLGLGRVMARDTAGAEEAFGRAIALDPDAATAWYNRGLMFLHAGDLEAAAADLGEAARLAPDNAEVGRLLQRIRVMQRETGAGD